MNSAGRRLHLQLTPLLDLLLIVIFAQYLDVTQQAKRESISAEQQISERHAELERGYAKLRREVKQQQAALAAERERLARNAAASEAKVEQSEQNLDDVVAQQRRAADLIAELFNVPAELVDQALAPRPAGAPQRSSQDVERLRERFHELASQRGSEVIEHVLSYDELRKRADVWSLRIEKTGEILFEANDIRQAFRAATPAEFSTKLYDRYKTLEQPKGLVIILVSYGDARADVRQSVLNGLPEAVRLMREDRLGRTQFEYAVLGYIPEDASAAGPPSDTQ
jgi:DNA repair exonuclease SbcCD ATPase subunit